MYGGDFHSIMDEESDELMRFSVLFDALGHLKSRYVSNDYHKGSGVWGEEFNRGWLVYVTDVSVEEAVCRV